MVLALLDVMLKGMSKGQRIGRNVSLVGEPKGMNHE